jgi:CheY-like chemotaxis protein
MPADIDVLVVEDNEAVRAQLVGTLSSQGLTVRAAANGHKALQALQTWRPKVMITDLYMPEMEGLELIRLTRTMWRELKIVAMSGGSRVCGNYLPEATNFGADATLSKPFPPSDLMTLVTSLIGKTVKPSELAAQPAG